MDGETPIICYGKDGPAFLRTCPKCHRFVRFPKEMKWREDWTGMCDFDKIECKRCGPVDPRHVGWTDDFAD